MDTTITSLVIAAMEPGFAYSASEIRTTINNYRRVQDELSLLTVRDALNQLTRASEILSKGCLGYETYTRPIVVGMGATYSAGSDRYGCTVIAISKTGAKVTVQNDTAVCTDYANQVYDHTPNPLGAVRTFYRGSNGRYANRTHGGRLSLGARRTYQDPSF